MFKALRRLLSFLDFLNLYRTCFVFCTSEAQGCAVQSLPFLLGDKFAYGPFNLVLSAVWFYQEASTSFTIRFNEFIARVPDHGIILRNNAADVTHRVGANEAASTHKQPKIFPKRVGL